MLKEDVANNNDLQDKIDNLIDHHCFESHQVLASKSVILFLGETGVGKSTVIDYLLKCKMTEVFDEETGEVFIHANNPPAPISDTALSRTLFTEVFDVNDQKFALCDCPGFRDNRGPEYEIAGALSIKEVTKQAGSLKGLVLLIDYQSIYSDRNTRLIKTALHFSELFSRYGSYPNSFQVLITKAPESVSIERIQNKLAQIKEETPNETLKAFLQIILGKPSPFTICQPLDAAQQPYLFSQLSALVAIDNADSQIKLGLSENALLALQQAILSKKQKLNTKIQQFLAEFLRYYTQYIDECANIEAQQIIGEEFSELNIRFDNIDNIESLQTFLAASSGTLWPIKKEIMGIAKILILLLDYSGDNHSIDLDTAIRSLYHESMATLELQRQSCITSLAQDRLRKILSVSLVRENVLSVSSALRQWADTSPELATIAELKNIWQGKLASFEDKANKLVDLICRGGSITLIQTLLTRYLLDNACLKIDEANHLVTICSQNNNAILSELIGQGKLYFSEQIDRLDIVIFGKLTIDCDLTDPIFLGKQLVITTDIIECNNDHTFDCSAKDGRNASKEPAASASGQDKTGKGLNGEAGQAGSDAGVAGYIILSANQILGGGKLTLKANGGMGGNGQSGGNGAEGKAGRAGEDATISSDFKAIPNASISRGGTTFTFGKYVGENGEDGKSGGNAGNGGNAGLGSEAGQITIMGAIKNSQNISRECCPGQHGLPGEPGKKGLGGQGGQGGHLGIKVTEETPIIPSSQELSPPDAIEVNRYFANAWYKGSGNPQDDPSSSEFDKVWNSEELLRTALNNSKFSKAGNNGTDGSMGDKGIIGGNSEDTSPALLKSTLLFNQIIADYVLYLSLNYDWKAQSLVKSLLSSFTLTTAFLFTLLRKLTETEAEYFVKGKNEEIIFLQKILSLYQHIETAITQVVRSQQDIDLSQYKFILFAVFEKVNFLTERLNGGWLNGNRITNLEALLDSINITLSDDQDITIQQRKTQYIQQFSNEIEGKITAGRDQVALLNKRIDKLVQQSSKSIASILEEIITLQEKEKNYQQEMQKKKKELQSELKVQLALGACSSLLSLAGTAFGAAPVFNGLATSIEGVANTRETTQISIQEINAKIEQDEQFKAANDNYKATFLLSQIDGVSYDDQERILDKLDLSEIQPLKGDMQDQMKLLTNIKEKELERIHLEKMRSLPLQERTPDEKGVKPRNGVLNKRLAEVERELLWMKHDPTKDEKANDLYLELRKAEISALKKEADIKMDARKKAQLEKYSSYIDKQEQAYKKQRALRYFGLAVGVSSTIFSGVVSEINTKKKYNSQIEAIENAIRSSKDKVESLGKLVDTTSQYKVDIIDNNLKRFLKQEKHNLQSQDTFQLEIEKLNIKNKLSILIADAKSTFSTIDASQLLLAIFEQIEQSMQAQIKIWDKIQHQFEQKQMGELIYQISSSNTEMLSWTEEQKAYQQSIRVVRLQYLSQLSRNAFLLWSFPIGNQAFEQKIVDIQATDTLAVACKKAKDQNNILLTWVKTDRYTWQASDNIILQANFTEANPYASISFRQQSSDFYKLQAGEAVRFVLPINQRFDAVKFATLYVYNEQLSSRQDIFATITLSGNALFSINEYGSENYRYYSFAQDTLKITHSMDVHFDGGSNINSIWSSVEDRGIKKFKQSNLDSGRSPYATVDVCMGINSKKVVNFWDFLGNKKLITDFIKIFPLTDDEKTQVAKIKDSQSMKRIIESLIKLNWIQQHVSSQYVLRPSISWSYIASSIPTLFHQEYNLQQTAWIKEMLHTQFKVFDVQAADDFKISFVGYGFFLNRQAYDDLETKPDEQNYSRHRINPIRDV